MIGSHYLSPSESSLTPEDLAGIHAYKSVPKVEDLLKNMVQARNATVALGKRAEAQAALNQERTKIAQSLSAQGLIELLVVLGNAHGVKFIANLDGAPFQAIREALPAWEVFKARLEDGFEIERAEATQAAAARLAQAQTLLKEVSLPTDLLGIPLTALDLMAAILVGDSSFAPMVLRAWFDFEVAGDALRKLQADSLELQQALDPASEKEVAALEKFRSNFCIGATPPSFIKSRLDSQFASHWPATRMFEHEAERVRGVLKWIPFWQMHQVAFRAGHKELIFDANRLNQIRTASGRTGGSEKMRRRYILFVQEFRQWLNGRQVDLALVLNFPKQDGVSLKLGRELLTTLITAHEHSASYLSMGETLHSAKINLRQEDVDQCFDILFRKNITRKSIK